MAGPDRTINIIRGIWAGFGIDRKPNEIVPGATFLHTLVKQMGPPGHRGHRPELSRTTVINAKLEERESVVPEAAAGQPANKSKHPGTISY